MRWLTTVSLALAALVCLGGGSAVQAVIIHTIEFDPYEVSLDQRDGYDIVRVDGCRFDLKGGKPMVPVRSIHLSIPAGMVASGIEIISLKQEEIGTDLLLYPAQPPVRLSSKEVADFIAPDPAVYEGSKPYPGKAAELVTSGNISGYTVAGVQIHPIEYHPEDGRVLLNTRIEFEITVEPSGEAAKTIMGRTEHGERAIANRVRALVENPEDVDAHAGPRLKSNKQTSVEYAIITGASYTDEFQPLADWKTKKGVNTEIFTTSWIYSNYSGADNQADIRLFVQDYEANHGLVYVLLGGDVDVVPARTAWDDLGYDQIRADLYFSDTDGDWNYDGDGYYGEYPADQVDMYGDIYVGRAPVNTSAEATNFVNQVLTYEGAASGDTLRTDFQEYMLFMGEVLWGPPEYDYTDGGVAKNMIDNSYVPSRFDPIVKLYQDTGNLDYAAAMDAMNDGPGITNHCGHCNYNVMSIGPDALYNADMDALSNVNRKGIYYTIGCWAAAFDYDNIAEHYVNNSDGGGVAFVGNSRYGWGCPGYPGECASDLFDQQFFRALFTSDLYNIGIAHADAKDYYVPDAYTDDYMRYCVYELNVLGDPEMPIWTYNPAPLAVSHPASLPPGSSYFTVSVNTAKAPIVGARVCLMKGTEVYDVGYTDGGGSVTLEPAPATSGPMTVTVTKHDYLPYEGAATVEAGTPPSVPTGLAAIGGDEEVSLSWNANPEPDIDYYIVYKNTSPNPTDSVATVSAPGTTYLDTDVVNDMTYYYRLKAVDTEGEMSGYSLQASATPEQPPIIFITHTPLSDTDDSHNSYPVVATITSIEGPMNPDSLLVFWKTQSQGWAQMQMTGAGTPDEYSADIPEQPCGTIVDYYILAVDNNSNHGADPEGAPGSFHTFNVNYTVIFEDDFESVQPWIAGIPWDNATTGMWERCDPEATEAQPENDHTPSFGVKAYITECSAGSGQGDYDVDGGKTTLLSPVFDLTGYESAVASYYRWYSNDTGSTPNTDYWQVHVSGDSGSSWTELENTNISNRSWLLMQFDVGSYVDLTDKIRFRFVAADTGAGSLVEAGVDDFLLSGCPKSDEDSTPPVVTVLDPNGGEDLVGGGSTPYTIRWASYDSVGVVMTHILLSSDGGSTYPDTLTSGALDSTWSWDVPDVSETGCMLKVICLDAMDNTGSDESDAAFSITSITAVRSIEAIPTKLILRQNRPNPFNPATRIEFGLPTSQSVLLEVFNVEGRLVKTLAEGIHDRGFHHVTWFGNDSNGQGVSSGIYFYRLKTEDKVITRKMILLK